MTLALEMRGVTKRFPGVLANDRVNFQLEKGEFPNNTAVLQIFNMMRLLILSALIMMRL